jgi:FixJ family two-component response regulator
MSGMWQVIHSLFAGRAPAPVVPSSRISIVGLVVSEPDKRVLRTISGRMPVDMHFAESCEEALASAIQLVAPVILFDRDWPAPDWRVTVERLAATPQGACIILTSGVADDYLWQELIRRGGYDILAKPLRTDDVARVLMLALSYWRATERPTVPSSISRR